MDPPPNSGPIRLTDAFILARRLSTPLIARRGLVLASVALLERVLMPVVAWAVFGRSLVEKLGFALSLGLVFSARMFMQNTMRLHTEADLLDRVVSSVIKGDVLRTNLLPDDDARSELTQAVYHAAQSVSTDLPLLLADALAACVLTVVILAGEPLRLVGIGLGMTVVAAGTLLAARRSMERALAAAWKAQQDVFDVFVDALEGRLDVVASGRLVPFLEQVNARSREWAGAGARVAAGALVAGKLPLLGIAAVVAVGAALLGTRLHVSLEVMTADVALLASTTPAFSGLAQRLFALARAERWMAVTARALAEPPMNQPVSQGRSRLPPSLPASIAFENVSFRYDGTPCETLSEVTFSWREGILALAGTNGSGKSTCLRLLLALARPHVGAVTVGGASLAAIDADAWRSKVAFLPQRPYLPPRSSVREAVHFLVPEATDDSIRETLERVELLATLKGLQEDPLAVRVDALSVGQRQRVGLARLLCRKASVVLLDEPDANLDRAGVGVVARLLRELAQETMVAVVAHSAELLDAADQVVTLDRGRVVLKDGPRKTGGSAQAR